VRNVVVEFSHCPNIYVRLVGHLRVRRGIKFLRNSLKASKAPAISTLEKIEEAVEQGKQKHHRSTSLNSEYMESVDLPLSNIAIGSARSFGAEPIDSLR